MSEPDRDGARSAPDLDDLAARAGIEAEHVIPYGRDVAKQLVQLVNSGRLARSGMLAAKIDYAGVLADDALWAAVVAFAAGTDPLDAAAHTQSLKKLQQERFPARRAPRSAVAGA